jgi:hypothetical protein
MRARLVIGLLVAGTAVCAHAAPGDLVYPLREGVSVRAAPVPTARVLFTPLPGEALVELSRQGRWIEVGTAGICDLGWVRATDVATRPPAR